MKKLVYFLVFCFIAFISFQVLIKNIKKPEFYVAGYVTVKEDMAQLASSYSHLFFAIYADEKDQMPYGASRQSINHDFAKGSFHFILDKNNFFVMQKGREFPKKFKLKVSLSKSDKISPNSAENFSDIKKNVKLGETKANFSLLP